MINKLSFSAGIMNIIKYTRNMANIVYKRTIKNYELDFYISGNRKMTVNGESFNVGSGSVVFRKPGDYVTSTGAYNCYCLTIDFSNKKQEFYGNYDRNRSNDKVQEISDNQLLEIIPPHFSTPHIADYIKIFDKIYYNHQRVDGDESCALLLNQLFFLVLSDVYYCKRHEITTENKILNATCKYIQENFSKPISINQLAENVSLSPSYFIKMFKKTANVTPTEYIISVRLANAKQLLTETNLTISQIAEHCGFNDASYFSYYFKKRFEMTPKEYRINRNIK